MPLTAGLRERKKAATRTALSRAAWSLLIEHGLAAATPEAIAQTAQVSPRTFRNYFASREEAIVDELARRYLTLADEIRRRPADEPLWDSLAAVLPSAAADLLGDHQQIAAFLRRVGESPTLRAQFVLVGDHLTTVMAEAIAERTGSDAQREIGPRLVAGAVGAALSTAVEFWARSGTGTPLPDLIRDCLAQLRTGLPLARTPAPPTTN